jgi:hypothetical protein
VRIATDGEAVSTAGTPGLAVRPGGCADGVAGLRVGAADREGLGRLPDEVEEDAEGAAEVAGDALPAASGCPLSPPEQAVVTAPVTRSAAAAVRALCRAVAFTMRDFTRAALPTPPFCRRATG